MPTKDKVKAQNDHKGKEARPFTIFYVNPQTPEEVHTDTIMALDNEEASAIAADQHKLSTILHVRGIGETGFITSPGKDEEEVEVVKNNLPCARFINGKFHSTTFSDDTLLESLFDQA